MDGAHRTMLMRVIRLVVAPCLGVSTALFVVWSWRWPLVGDAALIHYIGFLIGRGWAPYRQLGDMNMPGSFLIEMAAMKVFGAGDLGWRLYDFSLLGVAAGAFWVVTRRAGWFAAVFAGAMFALVHGRDGLAEGGQRDLTMAVCLVAATALLFVGVRRRAWWGFAGFGLLAGVALTIKPTALLVSLAQLGVAVWAVRRGKEPTSQGRDVGPLLWAVAGMVVGPLAALGFLVREKAVGAFWVGLRTVVPYYASLGHRGMGFLLLHSVSPLLPLVLIWAAVLVVARSRWDWERAMLGWGAGLGLVSYVVQARGLPYYRYPLLAFLLPLMAVDFAEAIRRERWEGLRGKVAGGLAVAGLLVGGLWLGPQSAVLAHRYRWWETDFISTLQGDLQRRGGRGLDGTGLDGRVQCVDSISGCGATLYRMRLAPATGVLSDFLLFGPESAAAVRNARAEFVDGVQKRPPQVVVVSSWLHMDGPDGYAKLQRWPWMEDWLAREYRLETDWRPGRRTRWWSREETPAGYRIYVRR